MCVNGIYILAGSMLLASFLYSTGWISFPIFLIYYDLYFFLCNFHLILFQFDHKCWIFSSVWEQTFMKWYWIRAAQNLIFRNYLLCSCYKISIVICSSQKEFFFHCNVVPVMLMNFDMIYHFHSLHEHIAEFWGNFLIIYLINIKPFIFNLVKFADDVWYPLMRRVVVLRY